MTWDANAGRRLFCATSPCGSIPTRDAATGVNTASHKRSRTLRKYRGTRPWRPWRSFIEGKRGRKTAWCDWNIPIHWGGMSDPFQPIEKNIRASYECLKLLAETKYPFVVSTKGKLVVDPEYLDLLAQCNCVVQVSMVCSKYDPLEPGPRPTRSG